MMSAGSTVNDAAQILLTFFAAIFTAI